MSRNSKKSKVNKNKTKTQISDIMENFIRQITFSIK